MAAARGRGPGGVQEQLTRRGGQRAARIGLAQPMQHWAGLALLLALCLASIVGPARAAAPGGPGRALGRAGGNEGTTGATAVGSVQPSNSWRRARRLAAAAALPPPTGRAKRYPAFVSLLQQLQLQLPNLVLGVALASSLTGLYAPPPVQAKRGFCWQFRDAREVAALSLLNRPAW